MFVNRKPVDGPWGGGNNFFKAIFEHGKKFGVDFTTNTSERFDAIMMVDPRYDELGVSANEIAKYKLENPNCPIIYRVNECDKRKATNEIDSIILSTTSFVDHYVFVSCWMRDYFEIRGLRGNSSVIYNGVNTQHFFRPTSKTSCEKLRIVTHHWSNNPLKGFDVYEKLDNICKNENIVFTYVGRDRQTFKNTIVVPPLTGFELGEELRKHDLYVSASKFDPGPNHLIEAIATGLPVLAHVDGGGGAEFAGYQNIFTDFEHLMNRIKKKDYNECDSNFFDWPECVNEYCNIIKTLT